MTKTVLTYKEKVVKVPATYQYSCDTCGYIFQKGERKVTYHDSKEQGTKHACYNKPCSPFSNPKGYERVWSTEQQAYIWEETA